MYLFDIENIAFEVMGYPLSYIELFATLFGLISVYLASRPNIWTWPTGIINELGFFILFFQVQLYADMLLQVYFFVVTLYGWYYWGTPKKDRPIVRLKSNQLIWLIAILVIATICLGFLIANLHLLLPKLFAQPADFPFIDSFTTVTSILAMILLARKYLECWLLWITVDIVSIGLYYTKGINLVALEYIVFLLISYYGFIHWRSQYNE